VRADGVFEKRADTRNRNRKIARAAWIAGSGAAARIPEWARAGGAASIRHVQQQAMAGRKEKTFSINASGSETLPKRR